jgi:hypothetical protein
MVVVVVAHAQCTEYCVHFDEDGSVSMIIDNKRMGADPTYVHTEIQANPIWSLAWRLSEVDNDNAPIGWSRYINIARHLLVTFELTEKE